MINRRNWLDTNEHLTYRAEVHQDARSTQATRRSSLRMLLLWADETLLGRALDIRPTLPVYLAEQRRDGERLAITTQEGMISTTRTFFQWALAAHPRRYRRITSLWMDGLRPVPQPTRVREREIYTLEEARSLLAVSPVDMKTRRIQAATAFLFLSGMRVGAFVTMAIEAVDLGRREVRQWTALGMRTKFGKSATTYLLDIPDLQAVVARWDARVRSVLPARAMWYPNLEETPGREGPPA